jgi:PKD repeat protein
MSKALLVRSSLFATLALGFAGCTIHPTAPTPDLAGPSSFGKLLSVTATPDNISADGSISVITATVLDASAQPLSGVPLQATITVSGTPVAYGELSQNTIYTNSEGQAKISYFSPIMTGFFAGTPGREVWVMMEPVGQNYLTVIPVHAVIKVTPPPVLRLGADIPIADVTYTPSSPTVGQLVMFDASTSTPAPGHTIASYFWDFGDNRPYANDEHGSDASHAYAAPGSYTMVLGVTDESGHSNSTYKTIVVGAAGSTSK